MPVDAPARDTRDAPRVDARDAPLELQELRSRFIVESTEPCDDWVEVSHPRGLPIDLPTTPTIVWDWNPRSDPLISEHAAITPVGTESGAFLSIGPDGAIWLRTDVLSIARLDPTDGHATWVEQVDFSEADATSKHRIAPDGTALATHSSPVGVDLLHVDPARLGEELHRLPLVRFTAGEVLAFSGPLAIGPHGRVYVGVYGRGLVATCHGERVLWSRSFFWSDGSPTYGDLLNPIVLPDGRVAVSVADATRPILVADDGSWSWLGGVAQARSSPAGSAVAAVSGEAVRWGLYGAGGTVDEFVDVGGESEWSREDQVTRVDPPWIMDPSRHFWRPGFSPSGSVPTTFERWSFDARDWVRSDRYCSGDTNAFQFTGDSDLLCVGTEPDRGLLRVSRVDGSFVWNTPVIAGAELGSFANDIDGRIYIRTAVPDGTGALNHHIVALQTDALPPRGPYCVMDGCNRHRNNWAHDYGVP